ncbi:hypothetical protein D0Z07_0756 [Hyphodiscus hymeniophilus]|uniref:Ricin B lectin domain-containing protein n=1 Tax=Hyphodiscus hymeniophilus TaxID=353542 RepID=A0A9P6VSC2_9HELO|nr:hypothetical protein D0Z07_0756 [Hyphodiscus hymeniophilus]
MIAPLSALLFAALTIASPAIADAISSTVLKARTVLSLNTAAFEEAQPRDDTATRAFSSTQIKTADGKCLFVDELSGDFRANLTPIQVAACDGSQGQSWDIITAGKHDDQAGTMLVVSTLTQACLNFDPRRAAGNTVILFSCGGRADGGGIATTSQEFNFTGGAGPLSLQPLNQVGTCLAVTSANVLDEASCASGDASQSFTFGGDSSGSVGSAAPASTPASVTSTEVTSTSAAVSAPSTSQDDSACSVTFATVTQSAVPSLSSAEVDAASSSVAEIAATTSASASSSSSLVAAATTSVEASSSVAAVTSAAAQSQADANPTSAVPVSRAGGILQPSSAAESNPRDNTATRAFSSVSIKDSAGQCLFIDPTAGDFRQNLIPVQLQACTGSAGEKFDFITAGVHNNAPNSTLVVSSLTQGCLNFDPRRAAGDTVILFSCGGRADGGGAVTNSQLFPFAAGETSFTLAPENQNGATCLIPLNGKLDEANCASGDASQSYTIAA